jgi:predicted MFS family arabinose efflux permease
MFLLTRILLVAALGLFFLTPASAQEANVPSAEAQQLIDLLENPEARDALIQSLRGAAETTTADEVVDPEEDTSIGRQLADFTKSFFETAATSIGSAFGAVVALPNTLMALEGGQLDVLWEALQALAVVIVVTVGSYLLLRAGAKLIYSRMGDKAHDWGFVRTLAVVAATTLIDILVVLAAWGLGYLVALYLYGETGVIGALPAAWLMRQIGRRYGFLSGMVMTALGGIISAIALFRHDFWLFAIGMIFIGLGGSFVQQYRFAAADGSPTNFKAQAISWVLAGGVFAAIIGPQTVIFTRELFDPVMFAGSFVALVPLALITMSILWFLRIPNDTKPGDAGHDETPARPLLEIISQSRFITAMICGVGSYALMTFMMTGAPLAMVGCGFSPELATLGIQWHVMAMFAPSFFTGKLIARFGRDTITAAGLVILLGCAIVAHMGIELWNFWLALVLLGVGWNFGFIGATTMVTMTYRPSEKNKVQGFHDVTLFGIVAFSSLMSGKVLNAWGWDALNSLFWPVALFCLLALGTQVLLERRRSI